MDEIAVSSCIYLVRSSAYSQFYRGSSTVQLTRLHHLLLVAEWLHPLGQPVEGRRRKLAIQSLPLKLFRRY